MKRFFIALSVLVGGAINAQQDYQFTHYMYDNLSFNPAYAGITNSICGTVMFREQWAGFTGNPQTALINVHAPVKVLRGGLGFTYINDQLGFENNNLARLSYSYHYGGLGVGTLGIGASVGIMQKSLNATWITPSGNPGSQDQAIGDDSFNGKKGMVPDFNLGVFYRTNKLYMGISATHLIKTDIKQLNIQNVQHYWITAGYNYDINPDFTLRPSILAKTDGASTQIDFNVNVLYKKMIWAGATYRIGDAIAPMLGYQHMFDNGAILRVGYSYGVTTSQIKSYSNGSHDIMLNYCFNLDKPQPIQKSKNPRFL